MVNSAFPLVSTEPRDLDLAITRPSMDEWILATVQECGGLTLDQLTRVLPRPNWSQVFLAIDRLSRAGGIRLLVTAGKDYSISLNLKVESRPSQ
jgi:hypothetical protein